MVDNKNDEKLTDAELDLLSSEGAIACNELRFDEYDCLGKLIDVQLKAKNLQEQERENLIKQILLGVDAARAGLEKYNDILSDHRRGHWDIFNVKKGKNDIVIKLDRPLYARNPAQDVKPNTLIAIDFGTSSTVVAKRENNEHELLRIGREHAQLQLKEQKEDFENPTVMRFTDIDSFKKVYNNKDGRPLTFWSNLYISHKAKDEISRGGAALSQDFCNYFADLKQWANAASGAASIEDKNGKHQKLDPITKCKAGDFNPIEYYAYNLGNYINNMNNGGNIYLEYVMSYPVNYDDRVREGIRAAFERGLKKSLPQGLLDNKEAMKRFRVDLVASEPAAYAITALQEFGFIREKIKNEQIYYAVFDFGGGTTDFDFGTWKASDEKNFHYEISHFGCDGDERLGGENILKLLAFDVFVENLILLKENDIKFSKNQERGGFEGDTLMLSGTDQAYLNTRLLAEKLRVFTELPDYFRDGKECSVPEKYQGIIEELEVMKGGNLNIKLFDEDKKSHEVTLTINPKKIIDTITKRIGEGVEKFFIALGENYQEMRGCKQLNIFLAGNSCLSPIVKDVFVEKMKKWEAEFNQGVGEEHEGSFSIMLWPPLGSKEAKTRQEGNGIYKEETRFAMARTGKSGVAFGLLDGRKGGKIKIVSKYGANSKLPLQYYVGTHNKDDKLEIALERKQTPSDAPKYLMPAMEYFEIYYTSTTDDLDIKKTRPVSCSFKDVDYNGEYDGHSVFVRVAGAKQVECLLVAGDSYNEESVVARMVVNLN